MDVVPATEDGEGDSDLEFEEPLRFLAYRKRGREEDILLCHEQDPEDAAVWVPVPKIQKTAQGRKLLEAFRSDPSVLSDPICLDRLEVPGLLPPLRLSGDFSFSRRECVCLSPLVFRWVCRVLGCQPSLDLFADSRRRLLRRYVSPVADRFAVAVNAFTFDFSNERCVFVNPPFSLLAVVVVKLLICPADALVVFPDWRQAWWWDVLRFAGEKFVWRNDAIFLDDRRRLRPAPSWATVFAFVPRSGWARARAQFWGGV